MMANSERYRSLIIASGQMVWITDPEGRAYEDSPGWRAYTGQSWDEYKDWGWTASLHPEERDSIVKAWKRALEKKEIYEMENRLRSANGEYRFFFMRGVPVFDAGGEAREWIGTCTDIHDYRIAESLLKEKNIALKEMLGQLEIEKKVFREQVLSSIEKVLTPILKKLKGKATSVEDKYIELLESSLKDLTGAFGGVLTELRHLTPKEVEICNMIRNGLTSKEIAKLLGVSSLTVNTHRTNIRRKLKISKEKINLTCHLQQS